MLPISAKQEYRQSESPNEQAKSGVAKSKLRQTDRYSKPVKNVIKLDEEITTNTSKEQQYPNNFYDTKVIQSQYFSQNTAPQAHNFKSPIK